ncbi:MAG TPA: hypothetical protein PKA27_16400 [Fimbriimonadaceae bacterium]|nr:hypothetical protein [Fimbriimonadaceae bacterium]
MVHKDLRQLIDAGWLSRTKRTSTAFTTFAWDGSDYLQEYR